jgi:hypothetical protein
MKSATLAAIAVLVIMASIAAPVAAVLTGTVAWNQSTAASGDKVHFYYTLTGWGGGTPLANISIADPDGNVVLWYNQSSPGSSSWTVNKYGAWVATNYNGTALATATLEVGVMTGIYEILQSTATGILPALLTLITYGAVAIIAFALVAFVLVFLDTVIEKFKF